MITAVAVAAAGLVSAPAAATQVWFQISGSGYIYAQPLPGFSFTATVAYDPDQTSGPIALVDSVAFTLTYDDSLYHHPPSTTYNLQNGSGFMSVLAPGFTYFDLSGGTIVNINAHSDQAGMSLRFLDFRQPGDPFYGFANGDGSVSVGGESYYVEQLYVTKITAVPEPITWGMMTLGIGIAGASLRTRRRRILAIA